MKISLKLIFLLIVFVIGCQSPGLNPDKLPGLKKIQLVKGDIYIRNVSIIDPVAEKVLPGMDILIRSGKIAAVQPTGQEKYEKVDLVIPGEQFYALPGFVNTHTHLWQHLSRSVSPSEQLQQWIPKVYKPSYHLTEQEFYELNLAACYDALLHGITSVIDWTINADENKFEQVVKAMIESGVGGVVTWPHTAVFLPSEMQHMEFKRIRTMALASGRDLYVAHLPPERVPIPVLNDGILLARTEGVPIAEHVLENVQCQRDWHNTVTRYLEKYGNQLQKEDRVLLEQIAGSPVPPSIDLIAAMSQNARIVLGLIDALPDGETRYNRADIQYLEELAAKTGPTYIPFLEHLGAFENGYLSIHSSMIGTRDIEIFRKHRVIINHNPESNAYLSSGIAPISSFMQAGLTVTIGTDGAASNDRIDMLAAMRLMSHLQKVVSLNVPLTSDMNSWGILRCATIEGAKALKQEDRVGSIEPGKEADIILFKAASFELNPVSEYPNCLADLLVNSAESRDIFAVLADGRIKVWDNQLVGINEETLAHSVTDIRSRAVVRSNPENEGRKWIENLEIGNNDSPIIRYRSIYPNYTINLQIKNNNEKPAGINIVISDAEKAAGFFWADETKARFPYDPDDFAQHEVRQVNLDLPAGANLNLLKEPGGKLMRFIISTDSGYSETVEITLQEDPEWDWTMRANVYVGARMIQ